LDTDPVDDTTPDAADAPDSTADLTPEGEPATPGAEPATPGVPAPMPGMPAAPGAPAVPGAEVAPMPNAPVEKAPLPAGMPDSGGEIDFPPGMTPKPVEEVD
jgi:hypothetical protein